MDEYVEMENKTIARDYHLTNTTVINNDLVGYYSQSRALAPRLWDVPGSQFKRIVLWLGSYHGNNDDNNDSLVPTRIRQTKTHAT